MTVTGFETLQTSHLFGATISWTFKQLYTIGSASTRIWDEKKQSMHHTDKHSKYNSIFSSVWVTDWVFIYEVSYCDFESRYSHLAFRYSACFELRFTLNIHSLYTTYS